MQKIVNEIEKALKNNKDELNKLTKIDNKYFEFDLEESKLNIVLNAYKALKRTWSDTKKENVIFGYYGTPYSTLEVCLYAILHNINAILVVDDIMLGINFGIVQIINEIIGKTQITLKTNLEICKEIEKNKIDRIICIGNANLYYIFKNYIKNTNINFTYLPYKKIDIYYDEKYVDLVEEIEKIAASNFIETDAYSSEENADDIIDVINNSKDKYCVAVLTENSELKEKFKEKTKAKYVVINKNPLQLINNNLMFI